MSDPWVLLTGPKGATGTPLSAVSPMFRRWCGSQAVGSDYFGDGSGFFYQSGYRNYAPAVQQGWQRLSMYRSPQGRCTYQGLVSANNPDGSSGYYVFSFPWDGLPNPIQNRSDSLAGVNNLLARFGILMGPGGTMQYVRQGGTSPSGTTYTQVQITFQTYVPDTWVDYGMKADVVAPGITHPTLGTALDYTVGPGQMSGFPGGEPYTVVIPEKLSMRLWYVSSGNTAMFFYYDLMKQEFNHVQVNNVDALGGVSFRDPNKWMPLGREGKVLLGAFVGASYQLMDRRFFIRGPADRFEQVPQ